MDPAIHLSWGDVAVDDLANPTIIRFFLKRSKGDHFGTGVEVFVGKTGKPVYPVTAVLAYLPSRGDAPGRSILQRLSWETADEVCGLYTGGPERPYKYGFASQPICRAQLPDRRSHGSSPGWIGRPYFRLWAAGPVPHFC